MVKRIRRTINGYTPEQRADLGRLAAIGLLGLLLGLFIGWVVWPVERSNGTLDDLRPDLRAHYLAALADSYVAAGGQNPEITLARVGQMQDPVVAIADAIRFYQANPSAASAVSEINLRTLAAALGEDEAIIRSLQGEGAAQPGQGIIADEPAVGWLPWLVVTLTALLLVVGGLWIAYQLLLRRHEEEEVVTVETQPADDDIHGKAYVESLHQDSEAAQLAKWHTLLGEDAPPEPDQPPPVNVHVTVQPAPKAERDESAPVVFETEVRVDDDEAIFDDSLLDESDDSDDFDDDDEGIEDDEEFGDEEELRAEGSRRVAAYPPPFEETPPSARALPPTESAPAGRPQDEDEASPAESAPPPLPGPATATSFQRKPSATAAGKPARPSADVESGRSGNFQDRLSTLWRKDPSEQRDDTIARFTAQYQYGIADYDESFIITANEELMGACGMGIDKELDPQAASSDKVQVLDVWFYDRTHLHTYNQLIVSRSMNWDRLTGKVNNSGTLTGDPLVAAPGLTFKLVGKDLILDCRIEAVEYLEEDDHHAPFRNIVVSMTVRRKK
jgi:hypothetical protein